MKYITILVLFIFTINSTAQKTLNIVNNTGLTIQATDIVSRTTANSYPELHSKSSVFNILPFTTYKMVNTASLTRFPYNSTVSTPTIPTWQSISSTGAVTYLPANTAWLGGANQSFYYFRFTVNNIIYYIGNGFNPNPYPTFITGAGFTAQYTVLGTPGAPIYNILIQ
ncbi:hypothetical protein [Flavobacterium sp.]|uniref:hypothetical protein n=1 Tax=Flavobacterium sp. TaxID=239 RepID=UPI0037525EEA